MLCIVSWNWSREVSFLEDMALFKTLMALQVQSFDQAFEKMNKALLVSCEKGLPVRVVRSYKVRPWHPSHAPSHSLLFLQYKQLNTLVFLEASLHLDLHDRAGDLLQICLVVKGVQPNAAQSPPIRSI